MQGGRELYQCDLSVLSQCSDAETCSVLGA